MTSKVGMVVWIIVVLEIKSRRWVGGIYCWGFKEYHSWFNVYLHNSTGVEWFIEDREAKIYWSLLEKNFGKNRGYKEGGCIDAAIRTETLFY